MSSSIPDWLCGFHGGSPIRSLTIRERLFREGDPTRGIYSVVAGRLRLIRHLEDGKEVTLFRASAGGTFALASLFADHYHCEARAEEPSQVILFPRDGLLAWLNSDPARSMAVVRALAIETQRLRTLMTLTRVRSAKQRLLRFFELEAEKGKLSLDRSLKEVASEIGLTHESVYRALATLEREGLLERISEREFLLRPSV